MIEWKDEDYFCKITSLTNDGIHSLPKSENKDSLNGGYWGSGIDIGYHEKLLANGWIPGLK